MVSIHNLFKKSHLAYDIVVFYVLDLFLNKNNDKNKNNNNRDPYSFFLKVVSPASIPKNMLALAKFWLPFQKWRIIGKKRRQNGYMLKNLCVFLLTSYDASLQYM